MSLMQQYATSGLSRGRFRGLARMANIFFASLLILIGVFAVSAASNKRALAAGNGPALSVDATAASYPINQDIYGACGTTSGPSAAFAREIKLPLCRWGGDNTSRYNWQVNASNSGVDFWFLGGGSSSSTPGANVDSFIDQNNSVGARSLITIPIIPYIEKSNDQLCAFSIKKYGYNNVGGWGAFWFDWNGQGLNGVDGHYDCADGVYNDGSGRYFTGNDPNDTSTQNNPSIQKAWVQHLVQRYGASSQSRIMYELDNEPSNWAYLHRDVVRTQPTYTDLINLAEQYAPVIKQADPSALVVAPDDIQFAWYPDWGGTNNMAQYLQAMKQYEQQHGQRILDIFSVHYPDANDSHWPKLTDVDAVRQVVDQNYPGTGIGFDEWNFDSNTDPLGGALATADQLGIFARDRVSEAAYWVLDDATLPPAYSFRMYRNYDGQGGQFGNTYLQSTSADVSQLSVYGARRSSDGAVTIMVINKTGNDLTSNLSLAGITPTGNAQVYQYSTANTSAIVRLGDQSVSSSGLSATFKANSLTMLVIPTNGQVSTPTPTPTTTQTPTPTPTTTPTPTPTPGGSSLASDDFGAATGPLNNANSGSGWAGVWSEQNGSTAVPGYNISSSSPLSYSTLSTSGNHAVGGYSYETAGRSLNVSSSGPFSSYLDSNGQIGAAGKSLYVSVLLRKDANNDEENSLTLHNNNINWCAGCASSAVGIGYFGSSSNNNGTRYWSLKVNGTVYRSNKAVTVGQTALLVLRIDFGSTTNLGLYVNPTSLGGSAPSSTDAQASTSSTIELKSVAYYGGDSTGSSSIDEIRLGDSFGAVTPSSSGSSGSSSGSWTKCADEGGTCSFSGTMVVRYGANGSYAYQTATGSIGCNNTVFGDPIPGTVKACYVAPVPPTSWTKCSDEGGTCNVPSTVTVAYGANNSYIYKTVTGSIGCNNTAFGNDPAYGTFKACYYM